MSELHTKHSVVEKVFFRSSVYGVYYIGAYAIFLENVWIAAIYIIFMMLSLIYVAKRFCSHCPYPCKYSDCLMMPYKIAIKLSKSDQMPMSMSDRLIFPLVMLVALPLIPQYWLFKNYTLLILFWAVFIIAWSSVLFFKCRYCHNKECILNITK